MSSVLVNKRQLAQLIGCSLPTLTAWIDRYADRFPVAERGSNGREYRFDAAAVTAFLKAERDAEEAEAARRAELLAQFELPGLARDEAVPAGLKPAELLQLARLRAVQRKEDLESGLLVPTTDVRMALTTAFGRLSKYLQSMLIQLARKHGWPDAQLRDAQALLAEGQRAFVRDAAAYAPEPEPGLFDDAATPELRARA